LAKQEMISSEVKLQRMIGLAARAGAVKSGEFAAEQSVHAGKAALCLLAADASEGSIKKFTDMCRHRNIPVLRTGFTKEALGHMIGRGERASLTVEDQGFAKSMMTLIEKGGNACDQ